MRRFRLIAYPLVVIFILALSVTAFGQQGRGNFKVFDREPIVVEQSKKMRESGSVFLDQDGDGLYDSLKVRSQILQADMDIANAYGVTYLDGKKVVYYPVDDLIVPNPGELALFGFVHYFDNEGLSLYFAVVLYRLNLIEEEALIEALARCTK